MKHHIEASLLWKKIILLKPPSLHPYQKLSLRFVYTFIIITRQGRNNIFITREYMARQNYSFKSSNPVYSIPINFGVSPHMFIETYASRFTTEYVSPSLTAAPSDVFTILEVSCTAVSCPQSFNLQLLHKIFPFIKKCQVLVCS